MSLQFSDANVPRDSVHLNLLKLVHFSQSYLKYKNGDVFETSVVFIKRKRTMKCLTIYASKSHARSTHMMRSRNLSTDTMHAL